MSALNARGVHTQTASLLPTAKRCLCGLRVPRLRLAAILDAPDAEDLDLLKLASEGAKLVI